jgi:hypothetical protein
MPTLRQQLAFKKISDIISKTGSKSVNLGAILKDVGYSASVCRSPQRVTETKGWTQLTKGYLPDDLVLNKLKELLESNNPPTVFKALDMIFKLKGCYISKAKPKEASIYDAMTDEQITEELRSIERELNIPPY